MSDAVELKRAAHLARRGVKGVSDAKQRQFDLLKRDGAKWWPHPTDPERGMWCPARWEPDWERGYPVIEITLPNSRV